MVFWSHSSSFLTSGTAQLDAQEFWLLSTAPRPTYPQRIRALFFLLLGGRSSSGFPKQPRRPSPLEKVLVPLCQCRCRRRSIAQGHIRVVPCSNVDHLTASLIPKKDMGLCQNFRHTAQGRRGWNTFLVRRRHRARMNGHQRWI